MHRRSAMFLAMLALLTLLVQPAWAGQSAAAADDRPRDRQHIVAQLVDLGYAPIQASDMAGELTAEDLDVLLANPDMMQRGGDDIVVWAFIVGVLIVAGIVVLAANGSGSVHVNP